MLGGSSPGRPRGRWKTSCPGLCGIPQGCSQKTEMAGSPGLMGITWGQWPMGFPPGLWGGLYVLPGGFPGEDCASGDGGLSRVPPIGMKLRGFEARGVTG